MAKLMAGRILGERSAREWKGLKETRGAGRNAHPQPPGLAERAFIEKSLEIRVKGRNVWLYGCTAAKKEAVTFGWLPRSRCSGESELGATSEYTWLRERPGPPHQPSKETLAVRVVGGHCRQVHSPVACWRPGPVRVVGGWITSGGTSQL